MVDYSDELFFRQEENLDFGKLMTLTKGRAKLI
jgi:hypothetical protein